MRAITKLLAPIGLGLALFVGPALADQPEDAWITSKVKTSLLTDDQVNGLDIDVDTFDGQVTLHGRVHSDAEKAKAETRAREVEGVLGVRNLLAVVPEGARRATEVQDEALQKSVEAALAKDPKLTGSDVQVKSVNDGVVVLAGKAQTLSAHRRAIARARGVDGVRRVASEIQSPDALADSEIWQEGEWPPSESTAATDAWITTKAKVKLMADPGISPMRVNVDTEDGVVTLFGSVETQADKDRAGKQIREIEGVTQLENLLEVVPDVAAGAVEEKDEDLTAAVKKRIDERTALDDAEIAVETANGVVRLTGTVASRRDQMVALTIARATPGVRSVVDGLELEPRPGG